MSQPKKDCKGHLQWSVESLLSDTSNQGTPPFREQKILSRKDAHIIYESNASIEGHLYSLAGTLFLGQAQNIFMPATTINAYFNYWSRGKQLILFPEVEPDRDYCFCSVLRPCLSQLAASSSPLAYMVYAWSLLRFAKENERLPSAYSLKS